MSQPPISRFAVREEQPSTSAGDGLVALLNAQAKMIESIQQMSKETEERIATHLDRIVKFRQQQFENFMKLMSELERLGLVDLAPVSSILGPPVPGGDQVP